MDANIRQLILYANSTSEGSDKALLQAFKGLQQAYNESQKTDGVDTCGTDLYILCAEVAYKLQQVKVCQECLNMYFDGVPLTNQFLCRAYLCQAQLLSPKSANDASDFETSVVYLLKAINFAKDKKRYFFIVYNASLLYWKIARPFLREGCKKILHPSLSQIVKALELIEDDDYDWRALLMITLTESYIEAKMAKEAAAASLVASSFCSSNSPSKLKDVLTLQIKHKLIDTNKLPKSVSTLPAFKAFLKLQKIKLSTLGEDSNLDIVKELRKLLSFVSGKRPPPSTPSSKPPSREKSVEVVPPEQREDNQLEDSSTLYEEDIELTESNAGMFSMSVRPFLLIDIARLCIDTNQVDLTTECLNLLKESQSTDSNLQMEVEFLNCELMVKRLGEKQEDYTQSAVNVRLAAIKQMDQALQNAMRAGNANTVQGACATQWNLCLPLLQRNLRNQIRSPLTRVAQALEDIESLQVHMRCQIHIELAKCEEMVEQIEAAVKHLNKALLLDEFGNYRDSLQKMLHRLQISTQLYRKPDRAEDIAAIIIEQASKSSDSGSVKMRRSLLIKAGLALAPDAFQYVLDSENELKAKSTLKGNTSHTELLAARAIQWRKCMKKAPGHLKRLGSENDRERARLWVDLSKIARKQQIWDVCRVAAAFCLLYDDGRWKMRANDNDGQESAAEKSRSGSSACNQQGEKDGDNNDNSADAGLLRMFAEVWFIRGEALIQLLNDEGLKLNEQPSPPTETRQSVRYKDSLHGSDWLEYADWIHELNCLATNAYLRAVELGIELNESWLVCNGAVYLWNYNQHRIAAKKFKELVPVFEKALFGLQKVGHGRSAILLSRICNVIAQGLLIPWIPKPTPDGVLVTPSAPKESRKKTGGKAAGAAALASPVTSVAPEAADDLQKALTVCEYALNVTNGAKASDCIPTEVRHPLLATWVQLKQMLQQQIGPQYGTENEKLPQQQAMTKSLILLEMLTLNNNKMMAFTLMSIDEVCDAVEQCQWDDPCIQLQVWTRLTKLAYLLKNHELVQRCSGKALELENVTNSLQNAKMLSSHKQAVVSELLASAASLFGQSLMDTCASNPPARRQAMHNFVKSAKLGKSAGSFVLVMSACRRWWNAALPLIPAPLEREILHPALEILLKCIVQTSSKAAPVEEQKNGSNSTDQATQADTNGQPTVPWIDDYSIIAAMYGLLIQTFVDKGGWEKGLAVADRALHHMPRTHHRLLLFKHRVIIKAKLGKSVESDIAKFRDESEGYVANMWHRVAMSSCDAFEQLAAFQKAIEALQSEDMKWQKFEYILQLATWMYSNEFAIEDTINVIEWACDIVLTMKLESASEEKRRKTQEGTRGPAHSKIRSQTVTIVEPEREEEYVNEVMEGKLGIRLANPATTFDKLNSVRQLEGLIRGHVMMAMVCGMGSEQQRVHCQLAYAYIIRLWKISLNSASVAMKNAPKIQQPDGKHADSKNKQTPATSDRPKRKGSGDDLPSSTTDWAFYSISPEMKQAFTIDKSDAALNKHNLTCAGLTVFYLMKLVELLRDNSLNHLSLPVLSLASTITEVISQSSSWNQLIIVKQVLVCYELHLDQAAKYWENSIRSSLLLEEEQVESRQNMAMKDIYEALAKQEEARILDVVKTEQDQFGFKKETTDTDINFADPSSDSATLIGRKVGGVYSSEIWADKARLLLKLGYQQTCRKLLNEALIVAKHENNDLWKADIYHVLADLAIHEGNSGQALQLISMAQKIGGDELFWKENIYLLIDAITLNHNLSRDDYVKVTKVVQYSVECLDELLKSRPTKKHIIGYLHASLMSHLCFMHLSSHSSVAAEQLNKLHEAEDELQQLGFHRKLASIHIKHTAILLEMCKQHPNPHVLLLEAIRLLHKSSANLAPLCSDGLVIEGDKGFSLPVYREYMNVELHLVAILLEAATYSQEEDRKIEAEEKAKDEYRRAVDGYVGKNKVLNNELEEEWERERGTYLHRSFAILSTLHSRLPKLHSLRAEWLYLYGRCLRLMSISKLSLPFQHWWLVKDLVPESPDIERVSEVKSRLDSAERVDEPQDEDPPVAMTTADVNLNIDAETVLRILSHASEILSQSVNMALSLCEVDIVSKASAEMVECTAQYDADIASSFLLLHQSAEFSKSIRSLLMKASSIPSQSRFASLLHQESWLLRNYISDGLHASLTREYLSKVLEQFEAWNRSKVSSSHLSLMKDSLSNFHYVVIQPSTDHKSIYCSVILKSKQLPTTSEGKGKSKEKMISSSPRRVFIKRIDVNWNDHSSMLEDLSDFQQQWMSFLLQSEYQLHQVDTRKMMLEGLFEEGSNIAGVVLEEQKNEEARLKEKFVTLLSKVEKLLEPLVSFIDDKLATPLSASTTLQTPDSPGESEEVIILASPIMHRYPLEYLSCFKAPSTFARDFSLQLLHHRSSEETDETSDKKKPERKPTAKGKKSASKPAAHNPSGSRNIDQHSVHYIIDPCNDYSETEKHPPVKVFRELLEQHANTTSRWSGLYGSESTPSSGQWEEKIQHCSMFLYYGAEKFITQYPPSKLASLNFRASQLALLLDKAQTHRSFFRQSKIDVDKTHTLLSIEKPIETAMLLSVCGVNAVCLNYLHTNSEENSRKLRSVIESLMQGKSLGQSVNAMPETDQQRQAENDPNDEESLTKEEEAEAPLEPFTYNLILFGLPNLAFA